MVTARSKGFPHLEQVILPFPLESLPKEEVQSIARKALDQVVAALVQGHRSGATL